MNNPSNPVVFWQQEIGKTKASLLKYKRLRRWPDQSVSRLLQTIQLGFYSYQKLLDSSELTENVSPTTLRCTAFSKKHRSGPGRLPKQESYRKYYDLDNPLEIDIEVGEICSQIARTPHLAPCFAGDNSLDGIIFNVEKTGNEYLYRIRFHDLLELFDH
ncbi:hypothetical protein ACFL6N_05460 [Thermodesulfobacteriota bacterium]